MDFDSQTSPKRITLCDCRAENVEFKTMEHGFSTSDRARHPEHQIRLINPKVTGATLRPADGFAVE